MDGGSRFHHTYRVCARVIYTFLSRVESSPIRRFTRRWGRHACIHVTWQTSPSTHHAVKKITVSLDHAVKKNYRIASCFPGTLTMCNVRVHKIFVDSCVSPRLPGSSAQTNAFTADIFIDNHKIEQQSSANERKIKRDMNAASSLVVKAAAPASPVRGGAKRGPKSKQNQPNQSKSNKSKSKTIADVI